MTEPRQRVDGRSARWAHRRDELLAAATDYVLERGVADLTLRPLAEAIGVTITTIIRQFGSKDELIQSITRGIHQQLLTDLREDPALFGQPPVDAIRVLWRRWLDPEQARSFTLMFELYGLALRDPERYAWFKESVVRDWLAPIERGLVDAGVGAHDARTTATITLALLRGLHLDLAATGEADRVNDAFERALAVLAPSNNTSAIPSTLNRRP